METLKQFFINLFGPVWLKENRDGDKHFEEEQIKAVNALSFPEELKRAALEAPEWYVRAAAVKKLDDPETLKNLGLNDRSQRVRRAAIQKTGDPEILKIVELTDQDPKAIKTAVIRLNDPKSLKIVASCAQSKLARSLAIEKIDDPETLKLIALSDEDIELRDAALEKLDNSAIINIIKPLIAYFKRAPFDNQLVIAKRLKSVYRDIQQSGTKRKTKSLHAQKHSDHTSSEHTDMQSGGSCAESPEVHLDTYKHTDTYDRHIDLSGL